MRKCKVCGTKFTPYNTMQNWCSPDCGVQLAKTKLDKKKRQEQARIKREYYDNDLKTRKEAAKKACHAYIRERDRLKPCICCDRPLGDTYHAGHFLNSGSNSLIRYDERNIHGQRVDCNYFKGGDSGNYRNNLIRRIGLSEVEDLESKKGGTVKRTAQDYKAIEDYYKDKLRALLDSRDLLKPAK